MQTQIPKREEIPQASKWCIKDIYGNDQLWEADFNDLSVSYTKLKDYAGTLGCSSDRLADYLILKDELSLLLEKLYVYANQKSHENLADNGYQGLAARISSLSTLFLAAIAFEEPELLQIPDEQLLNFIKENEQLTRYEHYLKDILRKKSHTLSKEQEELIASANDMAGAASNIFAMLNNADIKFPVITDDQGNRIEITHGRFVSLLENKDRRVRKDTFETFYKTYNGYRNTFAAMYCANLKKDLFYSKARHYPSSLTMHLDTNNIPVKVYDQLINTVREHLPLMHQYVALRKQLLHLNEIHMYDLYTPIVKGIQMDIPFEKAKDIVLKGLSPLGEDYQALLKKGFDGGWIDVYENQNKRSGAYSWGVYGVHPYVLLNYQNNLDNTFTLAHEMGHALHSYYSNHNQDYVNSSYSIFVAEVASICNESLLTNHLLNTAASDNEKAYLLDHYLNSFRGTLFRQTMFAEFEKITHQMTADGQSLTADVLCDIYHQLNRDYYGPDIIIDHEIDIEWARIPHFYTPFYVYQYATGFSAAAALSGRISEDGTESVATYKKFLSGGSSKYPIDLLKETGVDMTTDEPVKEALEIFSHVLRQTTELLL